MLMGKNSGNPELEVLPWTLGLGDRPRRQGNTGPERKAVLATEITDQRNMINCMPFPQIYTMKSAFTHVHRFESLL